MTSLNTVSILEICQLTPETCGSESLAELSLPLTFLDTRYLRFPDGERIYYFRFTGLSSLVFCSEVLPALKNSLSRTLFRFLPLAGNLTWPSESPKPIIRYSPNDAVSFVVAESNADFDHLVSDEIRQSIDSRSCVPDLTVSDYKVSAMALQITLFPSKGFAVGISIHHAVADGKSLSMFLKSWAHTCRNIVNGKPIALPPELAPSYDRTAIEDPDLLDSFYLNYWLASNSEANPRSLKPVVNIGEERNKLVRATYHLNREGIEKLREKVSNIYPDQEFYLSPFVLAYVYVSICLVKARGGDSHRKISFIVEADCRTRILPIPENYFGNGAFNQELVLEVGDFMGENGIAIIAKKTSDIIKGLENNIFEGARERHEAEPEVRRIGVSGSPRFKYYEQDFGWGKPEKVDIASIDVKKNISLVDSRYGDGGFEVGVTLVREEMEAFAALFVQGLHHY